MKKNTIWVAIIVGLIIGIVIGINLGKPAPVEFTQVEKEVGRVVPSNIAHGLREQGEDILLVSVREFEEWEEEHIPGAVWIPHSKLKENDPEAWAQLETLSKTHKYIITYCGAGHRSGFVAQQARERGLANVYNLDGISFWKQSYPIVKGKLRPEALQPKMVHLEEAYFYYTEFADVVFVDVREPESIMRTGGGIIKGAKVIPLSELADRLNEIDCKKEHVYYCEGTYEGGECSASPAAAKIVIDRKKCSAGKQKYLLEGYGHWRDQGYPVEPMK